MAANLQPPKRMKYEAEDHVDGITYETKLHISGLSHDLETQDLWDIFHEGGEIYNIFISRRDDGTPSGEAIMYFGTVKPSLRWKKTCRATIPRLKNKTVELHLHFDAPRFRSCPNPTNNRHYPSRMALFASTLTFGVLRSPARAQSMTTVLATNNIPVVLTQNAEQREITLTFPLQSGERCVNQYKIRLTYTSSLSVWEVKSANTESQRTLILSVENIPECYIKREESESHTLGSSSWNRNNAWYRKTEIVDGSTRPLYLPTSLRKRNPRINIGFWRVYCLTFDLPNSRSFANYSRFCDMLEDFNVKIQRDSEFEILSGDVDSVWTMIDPQDWSHERTTSASVLAELGDFSNIHLPFRTRYQLEVCISEGTLGEFDVPRAFVEQLQDLGPDKAADILEDISNKGQRIYDPSKWLNESVLHVPSSFRKLPNSDFTYVYGAVITPTTIHFNAPVAEISNRVLRRYSQHHDRFLRVKFEEERPRGKLFPGFINSNGGSTMDEVYQRIESTLKNGIIIGDRHYDFLGFGSSQFRENGAYFFASLPHLSVKEIRASMGKFKHIRSVSKYAARLGQCFSTTRPVRGVRALVSETPDIWTKDGKYIFTDGVGIISRCMAQLAASEMGMALPGGEPPSVLQFRSGGAKGVLAIHQDFKNPQDNRKPMIWIRQSQSKFHADYELLEVVRWSQFSGAHLNRQLIIVLSNLGSPDEVFISMMTQQIKALDSAMSESKIALHLLQKEVDRNQMTLVMASMIQDGFFAIKEPFLMSLLHLWRAWCIKYLKDKAKIPVKQGAVLLGCVDEFAVLQGHYHHKQPQNASRSPEEKAQDVPEVFVQVTQGPNDRPEVITGYMILTRSPSLHPGDIRIVRGIDRPELRHLKDVVVLPQTGDRDLGNMCSGGDLDGDDYLVIWDQTLLPTQWNHPPMDYSALAELILDREVTMQDIVEFFITYMKNDSIGTIANAHLATADRETEGVKSTRCLELAQLHSRAVDYAKSGHAAKMSPDLQPKKWPHFMNKAKGKTYKSTKILGKLFDLVDHVEFAPRYDNAFDSRILGKLSVPEEMLAKAASIKQQYDITLRRVMMQYDIHTEFEVWSTFALHHIKRGSDFKMAEVLGEHAVALKDSFRATCREAAGGRDFPHIGPFVCAMYEVTWLQVTEHAKMIQDDTLSDFAEPPPFISFPWIFHLELGKVANCSLADLQALGCVVSQDQPIRSTAPMSGHNADRSHADQEVLPSQEDVKPTDAIGNGSKGVTAQAPQDDESYQGNGIHESKVADEENGAPKPAPFKIAVRELDDTSLLEQLATQ